MCVYTKLMNGECVIIYLYIDDMLTIGTNYDVVCETKGFLASNFDVKNMGEVNVILNVRIIRKNDGIMLSQEYYIEKLLKKFWTFRCQTSKYFL